MIDLHIHTTYSDGSDTIKDILRKAEKKNLEVISITDHDTCDAYDEIKLFQLSELYQGQVIVGCEFSTSFDRHMIEILGYGFDYKKVNSFLKKYYNQDYWYRREVTLGNRLISILKKKGFFLALENCKVKRGDYEFYGISKTFSELKRRSENQARMDEDIFSSMSSFSRKGLYNPSSSYFLGYDEFCPPIKEIIDLIHQNGGKCFLAHPFIYNLDNLNNFLDHLYQECSLDGIECFYTTLKKEESQFLIDFAKKRNLLMSGGSDYHGKNKIGYELGSGKGNLQIRRNILLPWNVEYFCK